MSDAQDLDAMVDEFLSSRFTMHPSREELRVFAAKVALVEARRSRPECGRFIEEPSGPYSPEQPSLGSHGKWGCAWCDRIAELRQLVDMKARGDE